MKIKKNKLLINIIIIIIIIIPIVAFFIYPSFTGIISINQKITDEKTKLLERLRLNIDINQTKTDADEIEKRIEELDKIFIKRNEELKFIANLENIAQKNNVTIDIKPDFEGKKISDEIYQIPLNINIIGSYPQMVNFLIALENLPFYYNIDSIIISDKVSKTYKTNQNAITTQIIGYTYITDKTIIE